LPFVRNSKLKDFIIDELGECNGNDSGEIIGLVKSIQRYESEKRNLVAHQMQKISLVDAGEPEEMLGKIHRLYECTYGKPEPNWGSYDVLIEEIIKIQ
jgi:hypothetical protein